MISSSQTVMYVFQLKQVLVDIVRDFESRKILWARANSALATTTDPSSEERPHGCDLVGRNAERAIDG